MEQAKVSYKNKYIFHTSYITPRNCYKLKLASANILESKL